MDSGDITILHCGHVPDCTVHIDRHFTGFYSLQFMAWGGIELWYERARYDLEGAWLWSANTGPRIQYRPGGRHDSWEHRYIAFQGRRPMRWLTDGLLPTEPQACPRVDDFIQRFDLMIENAQRTDRWGPMRTVHILEGLLLDLAEARRAEHEVTRPEWLTLVTDRLAGRATDGFSPDYEAIARAAGMGLSTLRRRFKEMTGMTPHTYTMGARVAAARQLLGDTDAPIKKIAEDLGYGDVYFFARQFRQIVGVAPAAYRKSRQR